MLELVRDQRLSVGRPEAGLLVLATHLARVYGERKRNFVGQSFWPRGHFVSPVGRDEATIREYIRNQEQEDARLEQLNLSR